MPVSSAYIPMSIAPHIKIRHMLAGCKMHAKWFKCLLAKFYKVSYTPGQLTYIFSIHGKGKAVPCVDVYIVKYRLLNLQHKTGKNNT